MKVYIIGPMRGYPDLNFPAFCREAERQRLLGHIVQTLAEQTDVLRMVREAGDPLPDAALHYFMRLSLLHLLWAERVVRLPGWAYSQGALHENQTAEWLGLEVEDA